MNTTLQKRIEEAARKEREQCREDNNEIWRGNPTYNDVEASFIKGASFALQNQWISVDEALPPIREKGTENRSWSDWVLIMTHKGGTFMDCYAFHRKEWLNNGNDVTHWMMIPTINKEEK